MRPCPRGAEPQELCAHAHPLPPPCILALLGLRWPSFGVDSKVVLQPPVRSQRVETEACLARNLAPEVPTWQFAHCPAYIRLGLQVGACFPSTQGLGPTRQDHRARWLPRPGECFWGGCANTFRTPLSAPGGEALTAEWDSGGVVPGYQQKTPQHLEQESLRFLKNLGNSAY